ncbi:MAG: diguanylate cyclase [Lysobacter sp.]|nr:diguanylate cyclase [Lysobacter sp.]
MHADPPEAGRDRDSAATLPSLDEILEQVPDAVCVVDVEGRYLFVNAGFERIFGYRPEEVIGRRMIELVHPEDRALTQQAAERVMAGVLQRHFCNRYVRKDGRVVDIQWSARWSPANRVRIAVGHEVTELRRAEAVQAALLAIAEAAHAESDLSALLARVHQAIGRLLPADHVHVALLEPDGRTLDYPYWHDATLARPGSRPLDADPLVAPVVRSGNSLLAPPTATADGEPVQTFAVPLATAEGVIGALVVRSIGLALAWDEAERQRLEFVAAQIAAACERSRYRRRLEYLAAHDPLTGLPNRYRFHTELDAALAAGRGGDEPFALLYLDLDGFKEANDTRGHEGGDRLLLEVAQRLRAALRQGDAVARLGGDEFVVLLRGCHDPAAARAIAEKLRETLGFPYAIGEQRLDLSASIGIALYPRDGDSAAALLRHGDRAMYAAKRAGGDRVSCASA